MAEIIDLEEYREKHKYSPAFRKALNAVKEAGKMPLKGIQKVDEYFKKHPFDPNKIKDTK